MEPSFLETCVWRGVHFYDRLLWWNMLSSFHLFTCTLCHFPFPSHALSSDSPFHFTAPLKWKGINCFPSDQKDERDSLGFADCSRLKVNSVAQIWKFLNHLLCTNNTRHQSSKGPIWNESWTYLLFVWVQCLRCPLWLWRQITTYCLSVKNKPTKHLTFLNMSHSTPDSSIFWLEEVVML